MAAVEARVQTKRPERYLSQLCDHLGHMQHDSRVQAHGAGHSSPPAVRSVERTELHGEIEFEWGRCVLTASPEELTVRLEAADPVSLARGQELIGRRIETIGNREGLTVTWQPAGPG